MEFSPAWNAQYRRDRARYKLAQARRWFEGLLIGWAEFIFRVRILTSDHLQRTSIFSHRELLLAVLESHRRRYPRKEWVDDFLVVDTMECLGIPPTKTKALLNDLTREYILLECMGSDGQMYFKMHMRTPRV